jgi:2-phospho-L-lactate/phosphoenolpyruvate guanylyltransferase
VQRPFAIIPVKPLVTGKSRLAGALSPHQRLALNRFLFDRTLATAAEYPGASHTIVVSRSDEVLAAACARGMVAVREETSGDLNAALAAATEVAISLGSTGLFILPVDLPLARPDRLRAIAEEASAPILVLVPDRHGSGTNLLYQAPVRLRRYRFGPHSIHRHRDSGAVAGLRVLVRYDASLALDIDEPDDLVHWTAGGRLDDCVPRWSCAGSREFSARGGS